MTSKVDETAGQVYTLADVMAKLNAINTTIEGNSTKLELTNKTLDELQQAHTTLASQVNTIDKRVTELEETKLQMKKMEQDFKSAILKAEVSSLSHELNSKRFNIIVDGIPKADLFETPEASEVVVRDFLKNTLRIPNSDNIGISDAHRLSVSNSYQGIRPPALIFKLIRLLDKKLISDNLRNLKAHNAALPKGKRIFVTLNHLPPQLESDRKSLNSTFQTARKAKRKPRFRFNRQTGEYCLLIDNEVHRPIRVA